MNTSKRPRILVCDTGWMAVRATVSALGLAVTVIGCAMLQGLVMVSSDGEYMEYAGFATLSGVYFSDPQNLEIQQLLCFVPDAHGQQVLPHDSPANPFHWMCFSNSMKARRLLELEPDPDLASGCYHGSVTVTIQGYRRYIAESEGSSFSKLVASHEHGPASSISCDALHRELLQMQRLGQ